MKTSAIQRPPPVATDGPPRADAWGSFWCVLGLIITGVTLRGDYAIEVARHTAVGVALSIGVSALADLRAGFRNLIRTDLLAILALYLITLFEMLLPQFDFNMLIDVPTARRAAIACLVGFGGLVIGRHLAQVRKHPFADLFAHPVPRVWILLLFWGSFILGNFYMLLTVDFNPIAMVDALMGPRFTQPWAREFLGDSRAMLSELALLLNLLPPLAGIIVARRERYSKLQVALVALAGLFTLFSGFANGTRNLFGSHLMTFLIGYTFALKSNRRLEPVLLAAVCAVVMLTATFVMLKFRYIGLKNWLQGDSGQLAMREESVSVDGNFYAICRILEVFPKKHDYLYWEIPYLALIRPVPRALWAGKPMGMSLTIEDIMEVRDMNITASFIGEAYMGGGLLAVFLAGSLLSGMMGWWTYLANPNNSDFGVLIYASGFVAAVISMRSVFVVTTALLPTVASLIVGGVAVKIVTAQTRRQQARTNRRTGPLQRPPPRQPRRLLR